MTILKWMLKELESNGLSVVKVPTKRHDANGTESNGYVRVSVSQNAEWYRRFCKSYIRSRGRYTKARTFIKRGCTIKALHRMIAGDRTTVYATRLLDVVRELTE